MRPIKRAMSLLVLATLAATTYGQAPAPASPTQPSPSRPDRYRVTDKVLIKNLPNFSSNLGFGPFAPWSADVRVNAWALPFDAGPIYFQHHGQADGGGADWLQHKEGAGLSVWDQVRSGFWDGADVTIYRMANGELKLLRKTKISKSSIGNDPVTNERTEEKIWFADKGPAIKPGDYYVLRMKRDTMPMQIRKAIIGGSEVPLLSGYCKTTGKADWRFDEATVAPEGGSRASLRLDIKEASESNPAGPWHWFVTHGKDPNAGIVRFKKGKTYKAQVWLRQEGMSDPRVKLQFGTVLRRTVNVTGTWQKFEFDLPVDNPELPYASSQNDGTRLWVAGVSPGTLWIDNLMVYQTDAPPFAVMREDVEILRHFKPHTLRLWGGLDSPTLDFWLSKGFAQPTTMSGYGKSGTPVLASLGETLQVCEEVGADPWLILNPWFTAEEHQALMEYLAGPPDKGYGKLRAEQGRKEPWTRGFRKIYIESANEAWNQIMRYEMSGRPERYAAVADRQFRELKASPYYSRDRFEFIANGWDNAMQADGWTTRVALASKEADRVDIAYYFGGWEKNATAPSGDEAAKDEVYQDKLLAPQLEFGPKVVNFAMADPGFTGHFAKLLSGDPQLLSAGLAALPPPRTTFTPGQCAGTTLAALWATDTGFGESLRSLVASRRALLEFPVWHAAFRAMANDPALQPQAVSALALAESQTLRELCDGLIDLNAPSRLLPFFKSHPAAVSRWAQTLDGAARTDLAAFAATGEKLTYNITNALKDKLRNRILELAGAGDPAFLAALRRELTPELIRSHGPHYLNYVLSCTVREPPQRRVEQIMQAMKASPIFATNVLGELSTHADIFKPEAASIARLFSENILALFARGEAFRPWEDAQLLMRALPQDTARDLWRRLLESGLPTLSDSGARLLMNAMVSAALGDLEPARALAADPTLVDNFERGIGEGLPIPFLLVAGKDAAVGDRLLRQLALNPSPTAKKLAVYEGGPGYSLPGPGRPTPEEDENIGKSLALGTATLDASMQFLAAGAAPVAYYDYKTGQYWASHNNPEDRVPYPTWLALEMKNTLCPGDLLAVEAVEVARRDIPDKTVIKTTNDGKGSKGILTGRKGVPLTACYAFQNSTGFSVMLINRSLAESRKIALDLPAKVSGPSRMHVLTGPDPKAHNRFTQNVRVQASLGPEFRTGMEVAIPPASVVVLTSRK